MVVIVFSMASALVFTWFSSYAGEFYAQISTTLLVIFLLIAFFFKKVREAFAIDTFKSTLLWLLVPLALLVVVLIDMYLDRLISILPTWLVLNIGFIAMLVFPAFIYYWVAKKQPLLVTAVALNIGVAWLWLTIEILKAGVGVEFLLGPLFIAMCLGIPWIIALRLSWEYAKRTRRNHLLMGPAMDSLTMFLVAVPLVTFAILSVMAVTDGQHWTSLAGIIVSFLFSSAVSTPFARFLRALGGFDEHCERR